MNRFSLLVASLMTTLTFAGAAHAAGAKFTAPLPSKGQKSALTKAIKALPATKAALAQFKGDRIKFKVTYGYGSGIPGDVGKGNAQANVLISTWGKMLPGMQKSTWIGQEEAVFGVEGSKLGSSSGYQRLMQALAKPAK